MEGIRASERVMGLSVIVLEEAYGRGKRSAHDGLLSASELQSMDLNGVELMVLSQCSMADGVPTSGDGVYGMRRAAELAGVRTFVAPLWKVADGAQSELMVRFYREMRAGRSRIEALRAAKLRMLRTDSTKHFLFWAPVILTGTVGTMPAGVFAARRN